MAIKKVLLILMTGRRWAGADAGIPPLICQLQAHAMSLDAHADDHLVVLLMCMASHLISLQALASPAQTLGHPRSPPQPASTSTNNISITFLSGRLPTPNRLQEPIPLRQPVQAVVALGAAAHEAAECVYLVLAGVAARLVDLADADLDGGMVFGFDDAVCGRALAGDVAKMGVSQLANV